MEICARSWGGAPHSCHTGTTVCHKGPVHPTLTTAPQPQPLSHPRGLHDEPKLCPREGSLGGAMQALDMDWAFGPGRLEPECPGSGPEAKGARYVQGQTRQSREASDRPARVLLFDTLQSPHWPKGSSLESIHGWTPRGEGRTLTSSLAPHTTPGPGTATKAAKLLEETTGDGLRGLLTGPENANHKGKRFTDSVNV